MEVMEVIFIGIGLAMDAFAVAICKGLSIHKLNWKNTLRIALYFGIFQASMPVLGYVLGTNFENLVVAFDHWIAFVLLAAIGMDMIKSSFDQETEKRNDKVDFKTMIVLAIATSIDALAVGITFAFLNVNLTHAICYIGIITFILSTLGVKIGNKFGDKFQSKAELFGGVILILMALKILLEHLGVL